MNRWTKDDDSDSRSTWHNTPDGLRRGDAFTSGWISVNFRRPPQNTVVEVKNGEYIQKLKLKNNLWWLDDDSMYVYFTPQFWRPIRN